MLNEFLKTLAPMHAARARKALETQVRVNGGDFMRRHELIERRVMSGARLGNIRGESVLMNKDGSWLDTRNATRTGLDYAIFIIEAEAA